MLILKNLWLVFLGVVLAVAIGFSPRWKVMPPENRFERAQKQVVVIETDDGYGSAVAFKVRDHTFFLTAKHVIKGAKEIKIEILYRVRGMKSGGRSTFPARILLVSPSQDLAVLEADLPVDFVGYARLASDHARVGEPIFSVGNMRGPDFDGTVTTGIISQTGTKPERYPEFPWPNVDLGSAQNAAGCSGGGVFYWDGDLAGISVGNIFDQTFAHLPAWMIRATAKLEGWGWVIGDAPAPDDMQIVQLESVNKLVAPPAASALGLDQLLRGLLPLSTPDPVNPHPAPPAKKKPTPLTDGHRH